MFSSIECAKQRIRPIIAGSQTPEDSRHADNTLEWLLRLQPDAGDALQLAALAHDIERAIEETKVGDYHAVIPQITASACITGFNHLVLDSDDPFGAKGFYVGEKI